MTYPNFFDEIQAIKLQDDLASFLGVSKDGILEFSYIDIVKTAGHSCPTVLGAYLMTKEGLKALYKDELPKRGEIKVEFKEKKTQGVTGVIANVITNITGACLDNGFKGLNKEFNRNNLLGFEKDISSNVRFTRVDTQKSVDVFYYPNKIVPNPKINQLMEKILTNRADEKQKIEFKKLWQERVKQISKNIDSVISIKEN